MKLCRGSLMLGLSFGVILCVASVTGARAGSKSGQPSPTAPSSPATNADQQSTGAADASDYVGTETCKSCHQNMYDNYEKTPHWKTMNDTHGGPSKQGCEGCHGPGAAHVAGGGDVTKIFTFKNASVKEVNGRCMTCHAGGPQHMSALNSVHTENGISCISCHSPHHAESSEHLLVKAEPQLCFTCHLQQKAQFAMPFHHRVEEGLIQCSDCHNVHGSTLPKQVRASSTQDAVCYKCHTDKQGPFVYEHAAVKIDGCVSCHSVHGGPNAHMLKLSNVNLICLQCHTTSSFSSAPGAPSFHNQATFFQSCTLCHEAIHGSNFSSFYFK